MKTGTPFWLDQVDSTGYPSLNQDLNVDVAIVGGGMVGLHCAHRLAESGLRTVVLEAREVGRQATGRSTAKVTSQHGGQKYTTLGASFGEAGARLYAQANQEAVSEIARLAKGMDAQAGLQERAAFVYATDDKQAEALEQEARIARRVGLPAEIVSDAGLPFPTRSLLRFRGQYQLDPYRYLVGLAAQLQATTSIFENSRVVDIEPGEPCQLSVNGHTVTAGQVVVATQMPVVNQGLFFAKAYPFAHPVAAALLPEGRAIDGMFISNASPSHSLRTAERDGRTYLIAAGGEYRTGEPDDEQRMVDDLLDFLERHFAIRAVTHVWTNEDFRPMDGAAFIGPVSDRHDNLLVATGFDAWGISQGAVAAAVLAERLLGRSHAAAGLFDASRLKPVAGGAEFTRENLKAANHLIGDRLRKRSHSSLDEIQPGGAGVVTHHGDRLAVRRQEDGRLTAISAVCTHMGCIVAWNKVDATWDCPCHGSRFDVTGAVLSGPAKAPLEARPIAGAGDGD